MCLQSFAGHVLGHAPVHHRGLDDEDLRVGDQLYNRSKSRPPQNELTASLATAAGPAAIFALVARAIPGHQAAALGTHRSIRCDRSERQSLLWTRLSYLQLRSIARFTRRILGTDELRPQPTEDVIHDRLRVRDLRIAGPTARLEPYVAELVH